MTDMSKYPKFTYPRFFSSVYMNGFNFPKELLALDFFRLQKMHSHNHPVMPVEFEEGVKVYVCGDSWCTGFCELPALTMEWFDGEKTRKLKAYGDMTASGPVWQAWRVEWTGKTLPLPPQFPPESQLKRYWL